MTVTDEAIDKIKGMLLREELKAGDRLLPEKELAERLELSRNSLREAVKALELIRVLDVRRGNGTYVTSLDANLLNGAVAFIVELQQDRSVLELFEVRRIREPASGFMAASRILAVELQSLRATMHGINETMGIEDLVAHDLNIHRIIGQAADNEYLGSLVEALSGGTVRARIWRGLTQDHAVARTLAEHQAIADAPELGDAESTRALLTVSISGVEA